MTFDKPVSEPSAVPYGQPAYGQPTYGQPMEQPHPVPQPYPNPDNQMQLEARLDRIENNKKSENDFLVCVILFILGLVCCWPILGVNYCLFRKSASSSTRTLANVSLGLFFCLMVLTVIGVFLIFAGGNAVQGYGY